MCKTKTKYKNADDIKSLSSVFESVTQYQTPEVLQNMEIGHQRD